MSCLFENDNKISTCKIDEDKKEVKDMTNLELINNQITRVISKINGKEYLNVEELVILSSELRELVILRDELERIEKLRKQREEFKIKKVEIVEDHRQKRKKFLGK